RRVDAAQADTRDRLDTWRHGDARLERVAVEGVEHHGAVAGGEIGLRPDRLERGRRGAVLPLPYIVARGIKAARNDDGEDEQPRQQRETAAARRMARGI